VLEAVEALEKELSLTPNRASRATIFGDWPHVFEGLLEEGVDLDSIAQVLTRACCTTPDARTLGAMVKRLGWRTFRQRRAADDSRVRVLTKGTPDQ
jgi:hypothetical protein